MPIDEGANDEREKKNGKKERNVRESLDQLVLVADLAALVLGVLLRGLYLLGRGIGLAGNLSTREVRKHERKREGNQASAESSVCMHRIMHHRSRWGGSGG